MRSSLPPRPPSLFSYDDYRTYLHAVRQQTNRRPVALVRWARRLGYRSQRSVGMVLQGKRLPSRVMKEKLGQWLKFSPRERRYFDLLVEKRRRELRGESFDDVTRELRKLNDPGYQQSELSQDIIPFIAHWYHLVVKQLLAAPGARWDIEWLFGRLRKKVARAHIRESIERLIRLGFFRWDAKREEFLPLQGNVQSTADIPNAAIRMHHRGMLHRAIQSLEEDSVDRREFTTLTLRAKHDDLEKMKKRIREFRESFDQEFEDLSSREVFQLNVQLFTHTE